MRTYLGSAIALTTLSILTMDPQVASADAFHGTRSEKLVEKSHRVEIQIGHGYADLRVRRTVHNGGPRHDQATFYIDMPYGAVAVGLRTLGTLDGKPHWFAGELLEAEAAAAKYRELTGVGGYYPKDPALLSWRSQSRLALQVFPCAPGEDKTIEYTLRLPTEYRDGRHHLNLPAMGTETLFAEATIAPMQAGETVFVGDQPARQGAWVHLKQDVDVSVAPSNASALDGALASLTINPQKSFMRYHVEAAPRLGTVPANAHVVVLVDMSRSLQEQEVNAQIEMARAYVSHFPLGHVAIVPFDRKAHVASGGFVSVGQARTVLKSLPIDQKNGSHVDVALARADALLAAAPSTSAKRILLLTDARTREELTPAKLSKQLSKSGALLHVGVLSSTYRSWLERDDEHEWSTVTRPTGGLVWEASLDMNEVNSKRDDIVFEELARPKRIHKFAVQLQGLDKPLAPMISKTLDEGQGIEDLNLQDKLVSAVEVTGELWATNVRKVFQRDDAEGQRWAGMFFGTDLYSSITEEEMMPLAMLGKVVSPVTSYLAIEPGVRPSTEGLENEGGFGVGFGAGAGRLAGGRLMGVSIAQGIDKEKFLRDALKRALTKCGAQGRKANATLETTLVEIVSVQGSIDGEKADSKLSSCFEEEMWEIRLPADFRAARDLFKLAI